jgi:ABC-type antimicrobial peptide transport system permease subunit
VNPRDPVTLVSALLVVVTTALAANLVPAGRAAGVDPNSVLRSE